MVSVPTGTLTWRMKVTSHLLTFVLILKRETVLLQRGKPNVRISLMILVKSFGFITVRKKGRGMLSLLQKKKGNASLILTEKAYNSKKKTNSPESDTEMSSSVAKAVAEVAAESTKKKKKTVGSKKKILSQKIL